MQSDRVCIVVVGETTQEFPTHMNVVIVQKCDEDMIISEGNVTRIWHEFMGDFYESVAESISLLYPHNDCFIAIKGDQNINTDVLHEMTNKLEEGVGIVYADYVEGGIMYFSEPFSAERPLPLPKYSLVSKTVLDKFGVPSDEKGWHTLWQRVCREFSPTHIAEVLLA